MHHNELNNIIEIALYNLLLKDAVLVTHSMEWAVAHRLAIYLEKILGHRWNIDCEYNKMDDDYQRKLDSAGIHRRPDIVIHERGKVDFDSNLLVIEIKMHPNNDQDVNKLIDLTSPPRGSRVFQYQYGLAITFNNTSYSLAWFRNGNALDHRL